MQYWYTDWIVWNSLTVAAVCSQSVIIVWQWAVSSDVSKSRYELLLQSPIWISNQVGGPPMKWRSSNCTNLIRHRLQRIKDWHEIRMISDVISDGHVVNYIHSTDYDWLWVLVKPVKTLRAMWKPLKTVHRGLRSRSIVCDHCDFDCTTTSEHIIYTPLCRAPLMI